MLECLYVRLPDLGVDRHLATELFLGGFEQLVRRRQLLGAKFSLVQRVSPPASILRGFIKFSGVRRHLVERGSGGEFLLRQFHRPDGRFYLAQRFKRSSQLTRINA